MYTEVLEKPVKSPYQLVRLSASSVVGDKRTIDLSDKYVSEVELKNDNWHGDESRLPYIAYALVNGFSTDELKSFIRSGSAILKFHNFKGRLHITQKSIEYHIAELDEDVN